MTDESIYRDLQEHLDRQPVGYPSVKSGADIRLLKRLFTPDEAKLAILLSYKHRTVQQIADLALKRGMVIALEQLESHLDAMMKKGTIGHIRKDGIRLFFNLPLVVGMYEMQIADLTPEFIEDFDAYTSNRAFGLELLSTELPQMRTIPVNSSIESKHHVATFDQLEHLITEAGGALRGDRMHLQEKSPIEGQPLQEDSQERDLHGPWRYGENLYRGWGGAGNQHEGCP